MESADTVRSIFIYVRTSLLGMDNPVNELVGEVGSRPVLRESDGYVIRVQRLA
jgi:hypothetical protein